MNFFQVCQGFDLVNYEIFTAELQFYGVQVTGCKSVEMLQAENKS